MAGSKGVLAPAVRDGAKAAWPICLGYVPIGLAFGVLAQKAGLHPWQIAVMSVFVFAGSAQFIAVGMLEAGASAYPIIATTFMVNLRHLLMSSALGVYLRGVNRPFLSLFAYGVTDESFALNLSYFRAGGWDRYRGLCLNQTANLTWIASTVTGACAGQFIPAGAMGIDYALTAMFICLLVLQLRGRIHTITALLAGTLAVPLYFALPGNAHVIVASIVAATVGFALSRWARRTRASP